MTLTNLKEPFMPQDLDWRLAQCGESNGKIWAVCLVYIQARAVMDRLDETVGPENWKASYDFHDKGVICKLSIKINNEWVTKEDGAEQTDIEAFKGGISGALKRAASVWGIGRYLYNIDSSFATIVDKNTQGALKGQTKDRKHFYWLPPNLPKWALPKAKQIEPEQPVKTLQERLDLAKEKADAKKAPTEPPKPIPNMAPKPQGTFIDLPVPFGPQKGTPMTELHVEELKRVVAWAKSKKMYVDFTTAAEKRLNAIDTLA